MEFKDYYAILGVSRDATDAEIKRAFRRLAMQYHPDKATGDKKRAEEKFKEINEAYDVLSDPEKRRRYDQLGAQWQAGTEFRPPPGWQARTWTYRAAPGTGGFEFHFGGTGFSDFFEQFFGGRSPFATPFEEAAAPHGETEATRGADIEGDIMVTLEEALRGAVREITVRRTHPLTGQSDTQTYRVRIPPGVHEGQRIRLAGRGYEGPLGPGDLYLRVRFANHPDFRVRERDLYYDLPVAPWEAVLGARVPVPTLQGTAMLTLPPGTRNGQQFRLRGQGLPGPDGQRGDLYAVVQIEVPDRISSSERELWEQLRARASFDPRKTS